MTWLDRLLQRMRMRMAIGELPRQARVLDIGTHDGLLFELTGAKGVGIDPELRPSTPRPEVELVRGFFPMDLLIHEVGYFDAATAIAVIEHVPEAELPVWENALGTLIRRGGVLVLTVSSPAVDTILHILMKLRLVAGMEAHQHHGFQPSDLESLFVAPACKCRKHGRFQLGLNHLYVFERL